jgi:hypothetical protein
MSDTAQQPNPTSQALEDQNIFLLLGVNDGTDEEKEAFLDELQLVIWDDFVENDLQLLVTEEEMAEVRKIMEASADGQNEAVQEQLVTYLEKLIPDLEEIMLEKALELKEDMAKERVAGMKEYYADNQSALDAITEAEAQLNQGNWLTMAEKLNAITSE